MADENTPFNRAMGLAVAECIRLNNILAMNRVDNSFWLPSDNILYIAGKSGRVGSQMADLQGLTGNADMADAICLFNGNIWAPSALSGVKRIWIACPDIDSENLPAKTSTDGQLMNGFDYKVGEITGKTNDSEVEWTKCAGGFTVHARISDGTLDYFTLSNPPSSSYYGPALRTIGGVYNVKSVYGAEDTISTRSNITSDIKVNEREISSIVTDVPGFFNSPAAISSCVFSQESFQLTTYKPADSNATLFDVAFDFQSAIPDTDIEDSLVYSNFILGRKAPPTGLYWSHIGDGINIRSDTTSNPIDETAYCYSFSFGCTNNLILAHNLLPGIRGTDLWLYHMMTGSCVKQNPFGNFVSSIISVGGISDVGGTDVSSPSCYILCESEADVSGFVTPCSTDPNTLYVTRRQT